MKKGLSKDIADPFQILEAWYQEEKANAPLRYATACVVSTTGLDGMPNARAISIKDLKPPHLIFITYYDSEKGKELEQNNGIALTFWWDHSQRQIRIRGKALPLHAEEADTYFAKRGKSAQAFCWASKQSEPMEDEEAMRKVFQEKLDEYADTSVPRPPYFGGFKVLPSRIEFLQLKGDRFHKRICYTLHNDVWQVAQLQP
ncbi:pyridoxal 5'-phosphate synthase [Aureisphaera galaxeae]|uniref:pyridoxine/pyridoxamine 5'-phosphate oxidase n=1 Tax=Aureisphaera galaxeae TaxID=1538023 RepID=UPI0023506032|nr:pyridoxal 5'-phosphate synthase [Aureisphaera galaxeae]MDC8005278.1 pyridoxal 5'-phosphate synthase [Aureisphaera galaxeae]